jgi:competence protein ComFB
VIRNLVEAAVTAAYEGIRPRFPEFCGCATCREDVLVYALNRLPPRYVSSTTGSAVTGVNLEGDQERAKIEVTVIDGIRQVDRSPRCGRKRSPA